MNSLNTLFSNAAASGAVSPAAVQALNLGVDLGAAMSAGLGVDISTVQASSVVLVKFVIDDSGSISGVAGNEQAVRDGVNGVYDALTNTKQVDTIFSSASMLNFGLLDAFVPLRAATKLDNRNYNASGGTPLYDEVAVACGQVLAKHQDFANNGVQARSVTIIITDGGDCGSRTHRKPESVQPIIQSMFASEQHVVLFIGISDGSTNFHDIAKRMGIPAHCVLISGCSPSEIRAKCIMASQSAVRVSQAAAGTNVSQAGGFGGTP
jgi:uncharacterized protein YegL